METPQITMLGTGNAVTTKCYNTCFILKDSGSVLLVDGGGGNGILVQMEKAGASIYDIHDMFITHAHTDHILGAVWVIRVVMQEMLKGNIIQKTLHRKYADLVEKSVLLNELKDGDRFSVGVMKFQCFDIRSSKEKQFGFRAELSDGQTLACLGDEPFNEAARAFAENADWLMCEAFCLYDDREKFRPYEKNHSTALDAGILAKSLNVRNLILYHTEDSDLERRKRAYSTEAGKNFMGDIYVPDDIETIILNKA